MAAPPIKMGWLKKQSRSGLIKNWKERFVVLDAGYLTYFETNLPHNTSPYGQNLKGKMSLKSASIQGQKDPTSNKILLIGESLSEKDLLLEAETGVQASEWVAAMRLHIAYANSHDEGTSRRGSETFSSEKPKPARKISFFSSDTSPGPSSEKGAVAEAVEEYSIMPIPGFVVKTKRCNSGEKVFINVCEHIDVPNVSTTVGTLKSNVKWPQLVSSEARPLQAAGSEDNGAWVFDVVVNPSVLALSTADESLATRDLLCHRVLKHIKLKFNENIDMEYKLIKVTKKYKGPITPMVLKTVASGAALGDKRKSIGDMFKTRSLLPRQSSFTSDTSESTMRTNTMDTQDSIDGQDSPGGGSNPTPAKSMWKRASVSAIRAAAGMRADNMNQEKSDGAAAASSSSSSSSSSSAVTGTRRVSSAVVQSYQRTTGMAAMVSAVMGNTAGRIVQAISNCTMKKMRRYIPYTIIRPSGIIARSKPSTDAAGKLIPCDERILVCARKKVGNVMWLKTSEGWIPESNNGQAGSRVLAPARDLRQPAGAEIVSTRFEEVMIPPKKGWFYTSESDRVHTFTIKFVINVHCPDDSIVKISRSFKDIIALRKSLLNCYDKSIASKIQKLSFPENEDGDKDLLCYTVLMAAFVEAVGNWLREVVRMVLVERCKVSDYIAFITPNAEDCAEMERELMADGGMGGAWEDQLEA